MVGVHDRSADSERRLHKIRRGFVLCVAEQNAVADLPAHLLKQLLFHRAFPVPLGQSALIEDRQIDAFRQRKDLNVLLKVVCPDLCIRDENAFRVRNALRFADRFNVLFGEQQRGNELDITVLRPVVERGSGLPDCGCGIIDAEKHRHAERRDHGNRQK